MKVNSDTTVVSKTGRKNTTDFDCECGSFSAMKLPCRHIFAMRTYKQIDLFSEDLVHQRWTNIYANNDYITTTPAKRFILQQATPSKKLLNPNQKFKKMESLGLKIAGYASQLGTEEFETRYSQMEEMFNFWKENKEIVILELIQQEVPLEKSANQEPANTDIR